MSDHHKTSSKQDSYTYPNKTSKEPTAAASSDAKVLGVVQKGLMRIWGRHKRVILIIGLILLIFILFE